MTAAGSGTALSAEARELAARDPALGAQIERLGPLSLHDRRRAHTADPFATLFRIVMAQQLSTAAAGTIWERALDMYSGELPTPSETLELGDRLRDAGLSGRKVDYVVGLAEAFEAREIDPLELGHLGDEEVIERITALKGFGRWSAEMFLMFHLERPDVFSGGDLGLRRGIQWTLDLDEPPDPGEAVEIAERWRPQRTLASIYLWAVAGGARPD